MSEIVRVDTADAPYDVVIGSGALDTVGERYAAIGAPRRVVLISDEKVVGLYGARVTSSLAEAGIEAEVVTVASGEKSKSWSTAGDVLERMAAANMGRDGGVVALGGGVVGDLAGFCAATYMRGIEYVQVPTTLLAQVDSSVGGKTAVDLRAGKNLAGAFKQPRLVVADVAVLASLPEEEWRSGLAEVAKSGILDSEQLMAWMESNASGLRERDAVAVADAVRACVAFKACVVAQDERESGMREWLNYGHTFGHALEKVIGYGKIAHGRAVADGIRFAARLAEKIIGAPSAFTERQEMLLDALGLGRSGFGVGAEELLAAIASDKKTRSGQARFVLVDAPGDVRVEPVAEPDLSEALERWAISGKGLQV